MIGSSLCEGGSNNGILEGGEECDDGNDNNNDGCTTLCKLPYCGDGFVQTGEACDDGGAQGEFDECPDDCGAGGGTGGAGGGGNPCEGQLIYAGMTSTQTTAWTYGAKTGIEAGHLMCQQLLGADHVCEYAEVQTALANGELDGDPTLVAAGAGGVTIWVHRLTPEKVDPVTHQPDPNGDLSQPGAGGRCNEWIYTTNHISDGEYATLTHDGTSAAAVFMLDHDTFYDGMNTGHTIANDLQCNDTARRIPCCYPKCVP
jgi:cysteine-rich repeat protein